MTAWEWGLMFGVLVGFTFTAGWSVGWMMRGDHDERAALAKHRIRPDEPTRLLPRAGQLELVPVAGPPWEGASETGQPDDEPLSEGPPSHPVWRAMTGAPLPLEYPPVIEDAKFPALTEADERDGLAALEAGITADGDEVIIGEAFVSDLIAAHRAKLNGAGHE